MRTSVVLVHFSHYVQAFEYTRVAVENAMKY